METILVFVETKEGAPRKVSLELLSEGRKLKADGYRVEAVVMGEASAVLKEKVLPYADRLVSLKDTALGQYTAEAYARALAEHAREVSPKLILAGATQIGRDFLPRVSVLLGAGIASDVTDIHWKEEPFKCIRPIHGGRALTEISFKSFPGIITTRPNAFAVEPSGDAQGEFMEKEIGVSADTIKTRVLGVEEVARKKVDLTEADVIVSGGRGLKAPENFKLLEDLADTIGGVVGATRSVVDARWRGPEDQVGKSGKTVSAKLYIAAGLSGAIHHIMGMDTSKVIVAINSDPNANIFNYADYGIVGDLFEVLPAMTEEFKKRLAK